MNIACGQPIRYTTANAHAHNDYNHPLPFYTAYQAGFGSIEADIFLKDGRLYVAHYASEIRDGRTLDTLYLQPLQKMILKNKGYVYADTLRRLLLLVDVKTSAEQTLDALLKILNQYNELPDCSTLKIVITGNRPPSTQWHRYPKWLYFDARPKEMYTDSAMDKVALFSDNLRNYTQWRGEGVLDKEDQHRISVVIEKAHQLRKPVRFWATPDVPNAWRQLMKLKVDYINTDKIQEVSEFLSGNLTSHQGK